jgi:hypothetical protein
VAVLPPVAVVPPAAVVPPVPSLPDASRPLSRAARDDISPVQAVVLDASTTYTYTVAIARVIEEDPRI